MRVFWYGTRLDLKKKLTLLQWNPNFEVESNEKYSSQKRNKKSFEIPWPRAIECLLELNMVSYIYISFMRSSIFLFDNFDLHTLLYVLMGMTTLL